MGMMLARGERMFGIPAVKLRDALRRVDRGCFAESLLGEFLGLEADETEKLVSALLSEGWLADIPHEGEVWYSVTSLGYRFCLARAMKPVSREKLSRLLEGVLKVCADVNAEGRLPHYVSSLHVFGSYLGKGEMLGDLDLAVELKGRGRMPVEHWKRWLLEFGARHATRGGFIDQLGCSEFGIKKRLKGRSPYVSVHDYSELLKLNAKSKRVFKAVKVAPPIGA